MDLDHGIAHLVGEPVPIRVLGVAYVLICTSSPVIAVVVIAPAECRKVAHGGAGIGLRQEEGCGVPRGPKVYEWEVLASLPATVSDVIGGSAKQVI